MDNLNLNTFNCGLFNYWRAFIFFIQTIWFIAIWNRRKYRINSFFVINLFLICPFNCIKGTFTYLVDSWSLAIWVTWKIWTLFRIQKFLIGHLARQTIWRPKRMTWDGQTKLTYGALVVSCTSYSIWKNCSIIAIPIDFAILFALLILKQN
jgi:hypothetical protein